MLKQHRSIQKRNQGFITILAVGFLIVISILLVYLKDSVSRTEMSSAQFLTKTNQSWAIESIKSWINKYQPLQPNTCLSYPAKYRNFNVVVTCRNYSVPYGTSSQNYQTFHYNITVSTIADPSQLDFIESQASYFYQFVN